MFDSTNLTRNQFLIWTGHQASPQHSIYNEVTTFIIEGAVDRVHFEQAMRHVVDRTDALRMVVREVDGVPQLQVQERGGFTPGYVDLSDRDDPEAALGEWGRTRAAVPFDITQRTFEAWLVKLSDKKAAWYLLQHHILSDATSMSIVFRRVSDAYSRSQTGTLVETGEFPRFEDYVAYEQAYRGSPRGQKAEAYWAGKTAERSEPVRFYGAAEHAGLGSWEQERVRVELSREQSQAIRELARRPGIHLLSEDFSVFSVFAAVLVSYLHRLSSHERITIGVPWQNRPAQFADTVGLLMEQDPFSVAIQPGDTFHELIRRAQAEALDVMRHLPYAAGNPGGRLYDVVLNFLKVSIGKFAGMPVRPLWLHSGAGDGSLIVNVHDLEASGHFAVEFDFNCEVFEDDDRRRAIQHFTNLMAECLHEVTIPISKAAMIGVDEDAWLLAQASRAPEAYSSESAVTELIERRVEVSGTALALTADDEVVSYRELDARANQLARVLRARGVERGKLVGLCLQRSATMVVAQLAVLKAGGAYVPLDPAYPVDRLAFMAEDARLALLVTESALAAELNASVETLLLDEQRAEIESASAAPLARDAQSARPEDPAYVIYTSGSTGKPKGVVVPHRAVVNFLESMAREPGLTAQDRLVAVTTLSFDIAVLELLLPLTVGAQVVLASREQAVDGHALKALLESSGATVMQATPATWRMLLDAGWTGGAGFKALVGGEALAPDLAQQLCARTGELWNMYGPTETTVWSTCWRVREPEHGISIGKPIANTSVWILDEHRHLCPQGVPGEIYIGGDGVTTGYLHREALTAERFVPDPFDARPGARLYRTGDRGRWRADGLLEHLGRLDFQVKVRGHRIELGEIESALQAHEAVGQCVVMAREDTPGDVRLVAYIVGRGGEAGPALPGAVQWREHLKRTLPDYMVPQHFVSIDVVPTLPNGKVDRKALPKPQDSDVAAVGAFEPPATLLEIAIAEVWQQVLGVDQVGVQDNFFDLGGHSLLVMRAVVAIEKRTGLSIAPRRFIFESLRQMATQADGPAAPAPAEKPSEKPGLLRRIKDALF